MARVPVFYSFHYQNDVMRVNQVRNIGAIEGNAAVNPNEWETVKQRGDAGIRRWIDDNMNYRRCVIVLIGEETATRKWVRYEIAKAWNDGRGIFGIHIHNLKCPNSGKCDKGANPFAFVNLSDGRPLSSILTARDPFTFAADSSYSSISANMAGWVETALQEVTWQPRETKALL